MRFVNTVLVLCCIKELNYTRVYGPQHESFTHFALVVTVTSLYEHRHGLTENFSPQTPSSVLEQCDQVGKDGSNLESGINTDGLVHHQHRH